MTAPRFPFTQIDRTLLAQQPDATNARSAAPPWPRESLPPGKIPHVYVDEPDLETREYDSNDTSMLKPGAGMTQDNSFKGAAKKFVQDPVTGAMATDPLGRAMLVPKLVNDVLFDPMTKPHDLDNYNNMRTRAYVPYRQIPSDVVQTITQRLHESRKMMTAGLVEKLAASMALDDWDRVDKLVGSAENERNKP